jgi:hypothetical protein
MRFILWLVLINILLVNYAANSEVCARTIAAAAAADDLTLVGHENQRSSTSGYYLKKILWDATLSAGWGVFEDCAHPEDPWIAVRVHGRINSQVLKQPKAMNGSDVSTPKHLLIKARNLTVHSGDLVNLWQSDDWVHLNLAATAEQSGEVGDVIWLRVKMNDRLQQMQGVVRGNRSVEMVQ